MICLLGELIDVVPFLIRVVQGNIPITQLYVIIGIIVLAITLDLFYEIKKKQQNIIYRIFEYSFLHLCGLFIYIGFFMFGVRLLLVIWPTFITNNSIEVMGWLAINAYLIMLLISPLAIYSTKRGKTAKIIGSSLHIMFSILLITLLNAYWIHESNISPLLVGLIALINSGLSFSMTKYVTEKEQKNEQQWNMATFS